MNVILFIHFSSNNVDFVAIYMPPFRSLIQTQT